MYKIIFTAFMISCVLITNAQIKEIDLQLKYEKSTNRYNCILIVKKGDAYTKKQRIQFNSQISIVTPQGSDINIEESFMPLQDNAYYNGIKPLKWYVSNEISDITTIGNSNIVGIVANLSPTAYYNEMKLGDEIKLFSFTVNPMPVCGDGVRLFDNAIDPKSSSKELKGGDFSTAITIGSANKILTAITPTLNEMIPQGNTKNKIIAKKYMSLTLESGEWSNALYYKWTGPAGFNSNDKNPIIKSMDTKNKGIYKLEVTSAEGCSVDKEIYIDVIEETQSALMAVENENISIERSYAKNGEINSYIYPNPVVKQINLVIENSEGQDVTADIYSIDGVMIKSNVIKEKIDSNTFEKNILFQLESGVYILKTIINKTVNEHKFLVIE